jgi:glycosyltransferase involved in cell wall biosynthesis
MKVLILHPDFEDPGGVAAYYRKVSGKFSVPIGHLVIGTRPGEHGFANTLIRLIRDMRSFIHKIGREDYTIVHVNPSLDPKSLFRDGLFVLAAKLWRKKTLVFFRGWGIHYEKRIQTHWRWLFRSVFGRADAFIVLSKDFKRKLESWIDNRPVYREFTALDDEALLGFDIDQVLEERLNATSWKILFISRLLKEKGLYEAIEAVGNLGLEKKNIELIVAGDGPELALARKYAADAGYQNIHFVGYVRGHAKVQVLRSAHMLCFPTMYGEGMPNAVLECMGFGLPVITRPEGGVIDFFENGVHGFLTNSTAPQKFADLIRAVMEDKVLYRRMSLGNYAYAQMNFKSSQAARRLERIYRLIEADKKMKYEIEIIKT